MPATTIRERPALEDIAARTLTGDVRDFLLGHVRHMPKAWPQMNEREQQAFIDATERQCEALVRRAVNLVGSQGFESFEISVGDFSKKGNRLEAKLTAPYSRETLGDLAEAGEAGPIVLSLASMQEFRGERAPAKAAPDQPDLMDEADLGATEPLDGLDGDAGETPVAPGDDEAARLQAAALGESDSGGAEQMAGAEPIEQEAASPDAPAPAAAPRRRGRRSAAERVAANAAAAEQGASQRRDAPDAAATA